LSVINDPKFNNISLINLKLIDQDLVFREGFVQRIGGRRRRR